MKRSFPLSKVYSLLEGRRGRCRYSRHTGFIQSVQLHVIRRRGHLRRQYKAASAINFFILKLLLQGRQNKPHKVGANVLNLTRTLIRVMGQKAYKRLSTLEQAAAHHIK